MEPRQCVCGHHGAMHWEYGRMQGCSHPAGTRTGCECGRYTPISESLAGVLAELMECVSQCEQDWALMDRIDLSLGLGRRAYPA